MTEGDPGVIPERVKWSVLMLWIGLVSAAVILWTDVSLWFATVVLIGWVAIFVRYWPTEDRC